MAVVVGTHAGEEETAASLVASAGAQTGCTLEGVVPEVESAGWEEVRRIDFAIPVRIDLEVVRTVVAAVVVPILAGHLGEVAEDDQTAEVGRLEEGSSQTSMSLNLLYF